MAWDEFKTAAQMRDIITNIVQSELKRARPLPRIGQVVSINEGNLTAEIRLTGDQGTINARFGKSLIPQDTTAIVRVEGNPGNYYITEIINEAGGHALYDPVKTAFDAGTVSGTDGHAPANYPTGLAVTPGIGSLVVDWDQSTNPGFTRYGVYVAAAPGIVAGGAALYTITAGTSIVITALPNGTPLANGTTYYVAVSAIDYDGEGPLSPEVTGIPKLIQTIDFSPGSVNAQAIAAGAVTTVKIFNQAVTFSQLADGSVQATTLLDGAVISNKLVDLAVINSKVGDLAITAAKVATDTLTANQIAASAIAASELAANAVVAGKIAANAVTATELAANSITAADMLANTITANQIAANAITASELAANAVIAGKIAANAVTAGAIAANAVTAGTIAANVVTAAEIAAGAITAEKISVGGVGDELVANGNFQDDLQKWRVAASASPSSSYGYVGSSTSYPGGKSGTILSFSNNYAGLVTDNFPVTEGEVYGPSVAAAWFNTAPNGLLFRITWLDGSYARILDSDQNFAPAAFANSVTARTRLTRSVTAPVGARWAQLSFYNYPPIAGAANSAIVINDVSCRRAIAGNLIVNGAIDGKTITGATITGGTIQTASSGERVTFRPNGIFGHGIDFYDGNNVSRGSFYRNTGTAGGVNIAGGANAYIGVGTKDITIMPDPTNAAPGVLRLYEKVFMPDAYADTTTTSANVFFASDAHLARSTSLSAFKLDQQLMSAAEISAVLDLVPKTWYDKSQVDANGGVFTGLKRIPGLVAEDVQAIAPLLATYDDSGLSGVAYDRIAAALIPTVKDLLNRIKALELKVLP